MQEVSLLVLSWGKHMPEAPLSTAVSTAHISLVRKQNMVCRA